MTSDTREHMENLTPIIEVELTLHSARSTVEALEEWALRYPGILAHPDYLAQIEHLQTILARLARARAA